MTMALEDSIKQFFDIAEKIKGLNNCSGMIVLERILKFYETRITDTVLEHDGDMLLLQWGSNKALMIDKPTDFRVAGGDIKFEDSERLYLDFTRQVMVEPEGADVEFDDVAIQMSLGLFYQVKQEEVDLGNMWIESPMSVDQRKREYIEHKFVSTLLNEPIQKMTAVVGTCG